MTVRVGFDVTPLVRPVPPGVRRATQGMVETLERRGVLDVVRLEPPPGRGLRAWRGEALGRAVRDQGLAGVHSFFSAFAWRAPGRRVQTVHELPWRHGVRENGGLRHRLWAKLGPALADAVVCPTEHVARDLTRYALVGVRRIRVVPWGVGPPFQPDPDAGEVDEVLLERYRLGEDPFALCLGAVRAKKNLAAVLQGLAVLRDRGRHTLGLVVTGSPTADLRRDLGLASRLGLARWVHTLDAVEDGDLPGLLRLATAAPVLSHSEGFGLPVLEALACGTPVLVPPGSAQAEVAGPEAFVVDPADPQAVADGLERALEEREALRYQLPERAAAYTWDGAAAKLEALWRDLA